MLSFLRLSLLATVGCLSLTACKKEEEEGLSRKELLQRAHWQVRELYVQTNGQKGHDFYANYQPCKRDNDWVFQAAGTYLHQEGPTRCAENDPDYYGGQWQLTENLSQNTAQLRIKSDREVETAVWDIISLDKTTLSLEMPTAQAGSKYVWILQAL
ncbi:hypothetical protein [Hymenobacter sp. BT730]|uniref:hypothetical protein n=1 Tax=Hymenobacter sp. BT730 TaxID=3063332 RepID=UPI0026E0DF5C|nr:hypothetical protein [Hymenobacter sp. BT730]